MATVYQMRPQAPVPEQAERWRVLADALEALAALTRAEAERATESAVVPPVEDDPMLTVAEAAAELRRSPAHVRAQCKAGRLVAMRDGVGYRIRRSALRTYERRRTPR